MLIRGTDCAKPCFNAIGDTGQGTIMQKMRNISPIANVDLLPCVINCGTCICRIFQLDHTQRHSVDKEKNIWPAVFCLPVVRILHGELIDCTENVIFRMLKINQGYHSGQTILRCELDAVYHPTIHLVQCGKIALCTGQADCVDDLPNLVRSQLRIGIA